MEKNDRNYLWETQAKLYSAADELGELFIFPAPSTPKNEYARALNLRKRIIKIAHDLEKLIDDAIESGEGL